MFSSRTFIVSQLLSQSFSNFELILVYWRPFEDGRYWRMIRAVTRPSVSANGHLLKLVSSLPHRQETEWRGFGDWPSWLQFKGMTARSLTNTFLVCRRYLYIPKVQRKDLQVWAVRQMLWRKESYGPMSGFDSNKDWIIWQPLVLPGRNLKGAGSSQEHGLRLPEAMLGLIMSLREDT